MFKWIKNKYENWRLSKYYLSIKGCPMDNWIALYENSDLRQLSKSGKVCKRVVQVYEKLQDEIVDNFGVNDNFLKIHKNKIKIVSLLAQQIETGDYSTEYKIEMLKLDNETIEKNQVKIDFNESIIAIEKNMGFKINRKELTVFDFYKYSKTIATKLKPDSK